MLPRQHGEKAQRKGHKKHTFFELSPNPPGNKPEDQNRGRAEHNRHLVFLYEVPMVRAPLGIPLLWPSKKPNKEHGVINTSSAFEYETLVVSASCSCPAASGIWPPPGKRSFDGHIIQNRCEMNSKPEVWEPQAWFFASAHLQSCHQEGNLT